MTFEGLDALPRENLFEQFCEMYRKHPETKIIIFGAGNQGILTALELQEQHIAPYAFCDNDAGKRGTKIKGIPVIGVTDLAALPGEIAVVNNDSYRREKKAQLISAEIAAERIFSFDVLNPLFKKMTRSYIEAHTNEFRGVYDWLADEDSRRTLLNYLAGVYTADLAYYEEIAVGNDYFPAGIVPLRDDHVFLDVGAYSGDTIEAFINFFAGKYSRIYAFEPFPKTAELIEKKHFPRTEVHVAAAARQKGRTTLFCGEYNDLTMVTTVSEVGAVQPQEITLNTVAIDDVIAGGEASFIKMDIEGSKMDALYGASKTIRRNRPFLAICVYHKRDDLIRIPSYIKQLVPEYQMYLRHHSKTAADLVLYCV